uniref:receptor protein serine/threonine kinase n=1 Tax=Protopterus annectens TaxID=7888 RepID=A0A2U9NKL0_PROAN|nr:AMHR2 [Protopterus annectens]
MPALVLQFLLYLTTLLQQVKMERICWFQSSRNNWKVLAEAGTIEDGETQRCHESNCCFGVWNQSKSGELYAMLQGCWFDFRQKLDCPSSNCIPGVDERFGIHYSCYCSSDLCNRNFTVYPTLDLPNEQSRHAEVITVLVVMVPLVVVMASCCIAIKKRCTSKCLGQHAILNPDLEMKERVPMFQNMGETSALDHNLDSLELIEVIERGMFGEVWKGTLYGVSVAVKAVPASGIEHFINERDLYSMALMKHDNIAKFHAAGERLENNRKESLLVLSFYPYGSLAKHLANHTNDWETTLNLCLTLSRGLTFLHTEMWKDGQYKPAIAHRDLGSHNILVKTDRTCAIADFGLAMTLSKETQYSVLKVDSLTICKVGCLRYRSPELLDESLQLKDVSTALKQVDVYALGLILWEIFMRCTPLFKGIHVPAFKLPFEEELGRCLTTDKIRFAVCEKMVRPQIPQIWKENTKDYESILEILEDSWDQDPEARLMAPSTEWRFQRLLGTCQLYGSTSTAQQ